jgi:flagellar hook-associated protein 1 FlgK
MGASALMALGMRAMAANYAALQATGNNIANVNTVGYSRQSAEFETAGGQFSGAGFFGKGVNVSTIARAHSDFLTREAATTRALSAADQARSAQLQQLEKVFGLGEAGLGSAASELFNAFVDVASLPRDASARQVVLANAGELAARFRSAAGQIDSIQAGVTQDLRTGIASVNALSTRIAALNDQIAKAKGAGHAPNDLLDQREQAINDLSQYLQVTTIGADDGSTSVFIGGGQRLVLGTQVTRLTAVADVFDSSKVQLGIDDSGTAREIPQDLVTGGSIAGLLRFQNDDLVDARNQLGQLASAISGSVNVQQALGLDLGNPPAAGAPLFSVGSLLVQGASTNTGGSSVSLALVDSRELQASDYELYADPALPAGDYRLTRRSDGVQTTVSDGDVVDGFRISIGSAPAPAARDRFLLQPVGAAARNTVRVLDNPNGLAAASPVMATLAAANTGTASVASLAATAANLAAAPLTATLGFTDNSGAYTWQLRDSSNAVVRSGTGSWRAGQAIRSDTWTPATPAQRHDWQMLLNGVPRSGDVITVGATAFPAADNGNAQALLALRDAGIVGQRTVSGVLQPGQTVTDAYANTLADMGVRVQGAKFAAEQSESIAADAKTAKASQSGVNLDEEAARLIQFQQSYQAAAKMLQVAQSVFDTLLQTAR